MANLAAVDGVRLCLYSTAENDVRIRFVRRGDNGADVFNQLRALPEASVKYVCNAHGTQGDVPCRKCEEHNSFEHASMMDATVNAMRRAGRSLEGIIAQLVTEKESLRQRIMELDSIAPRKIKLEDGKVIVWRCPDHLIPESRAAKQTPLRVPGSNFPANWIVHTPNGPIPCCDNHADDVMTLMEFMGVHTTRQATSGVECVNCVNEQKRSKNTVDAAPVQREKSLNP